MTLSSAGQNPRGTLFGNRDRARRPCEGFSDESATGRRPIREPRLECGAGFSLRGFALARPKTRRLKPAPHSGRGRAFGCATETGRPRSMATDTFCASRRGRSTALQSCCAMIFCSSGSLWALTFKSRGARRSIPMMSLDRSTFPWRSILFVFILLGIPGAARSSNLEDSAKNSPERSQQLCRRTKRSSASTKLLLSAGR